MSALYVFKEVEVTTDYTEFASKEALKKYIAEGGEVLLQDQSAFSPLADGRWFTLADGLIRPGTPFVLDPTTRRKFGQFVKDRTGSWAVK